MKPTTSTIPRDGLHVARPAADGAAPESRLGRAYRKVYSGLCGVHPRLRPWHYQWLSARLLTGTFRDLLPTLSGRVLDVGCGEKPYRDLFAAASEYVGLDVVAAPGVDIVVQPGETWPLPDRHFDVLISNQVLEHVADLDFTVSEIKRVVKDGGVIVVSVPFIYNEHGSPNDFQRFTVFRARQLFDEFEVLHLEKQGGIGSTVTILVLNWVDLALGATKPGRFLKAPLLPIWLLFTLLMNIGALAANAIDPTQLFYSNVDVVLRKTAS